MLSTVTLLSLLLLSPVQPPAAAAANELKLTNIRITYGDVGGPRQVKGLLPGDILFVNFDIEGVSIDEAGKVQYTMNIELTDSAGKSYHKTEPTTNVNFVPLGGSKIPGRAYLTIGFEQPAGDYNLTVTMTDLVSKATKSITQKFTVLPKDFGIIAVYMSVDERGAIPAPNSAFVGQSLFVQFAVVNFGRSADKQLPNLVFEMAPLDEKGNPTVGKPTTFTLDSGIKPDEPVVTVRYLLPFTRAGKFLVRLKAIDKVTGKTATFDLPVTALPNS